MKVTKKSILKYILELLMIAFGVFLGIEVSEYRADKNMRENVSESLELITKELESNLLTLEKSIRYHETIKKGFDSIINTISIDNAYLPYFSNKVFKHNSIPNWNGLGIPVVEDIAFESAKIGGIFQELDIEEIKLISNAYKKLHTNTELGRSLTTKFIGINSDTKILDIVGILELLTNDVLMTEKVLKDNLDKTILKLKDNTLTRNP
ncbi:hypothetical protein EGM88_10545 [Aureibaculum marinum]|uniref:Uncharacterized protein n=1 Tax=Aureibaculum marinum TaxID=2487930 RepID=A0A3N4NNS5_9FLAO|nr:hypothetical protein [Aureibaculum marinum]RPD96198.1 hypothetical protein EGM88_10545 [Aureibaculum marinum]